MSEGGLGGATTTTTIERVSRGNHRIYRPGIDVCPCLSNGMCKFMMCEEQDPLKWLLQLIGFIYIEQVRLSNGAD